MDYGPFPIRWWRLLGGVGATALGVLLLVFAILPDTLVCGSTNVPCRLERPLRGTLELPRSALLRAHVVETRGSKGGTFGVPIVETTQGEIRLRDVSPEEARAFARTVNEALASGAPFEGSAREPWWMIAFFGAMTAMGLALIATALRGIGRYRLTLDPARHELTVERRALGLPLWRKSVSTQDVVDVEIEWTRRKDFFHRHHELGDTVGRLALVTDDGDRRLIDGPYHRGFTLHQRAADQLRAMLGCSALSAHEVARVGAEAQGFRPPPTTMQGLGGFAAAWMGMCCGSLAGIALYGGIGLSLGLFKMSDSMDGTATVVGGGGGAAAGVAIALWLTRPREPR